MHCRAATPACPSPPPSHIRPRGLSRALLVVLSPDVRPAAGGGKRETVTGMTMSEKLQTAVNDSIAAARRSGLKSKGDIASYVARDPSVRAMARQSDGQLNMAELAQAIAQEWAFEEKIWESLVRR